MNVLDGPGHEPAGRRRRPGSSRTAARMLRGESPMASAHPGSLPAGPPLLGVARIVGGQVVDVTVWFGTAAAARSWADSVGWTEDVYIVTPVLLASPP